ncbi:MAG: Oligopeptide transport ATP-binding protein OppF [Phycisphaerae bacterium]|nr:Oligopeptide transport ATP-binding protein OppF [Phycisphaerae bacterium]
MSDSDDGYLLDVDRATVCYRTSAGAGVRALDQVCLRLREGEGLALVGESGSGKSTLARAVMRLIDLHSGCIRFRGDEVSSLRSDALRRFRREVHLVFQDPAGSLNPRRSVRDLVSEPLRIHGATSRKTVSVRVARALEDVGLRPDFLDRYPGELSGGQRQRVALARAVVTDPRLLILDEPTSALDVSVQAEVLNLLIDLRKRRGLSCLLITHNLSIVPFLCERVAVLERGRLAESGEVSAVFGAPVAEYTRNLLAAVLPPPLPDDRRIRI